MYQPNYRVEIPCKHPLRYGSADDYVVWRIQEGNNDIELYRCIGCFTVNGFGYYCSTCRFWAHEKCLDFPEILELSYHSHPLKKVSTEAIDYTDGTCHFCGDELGDQMYHCSICNFSIDFKCSRNLLLHNIYHRKSHNHPLSLMARKVSFTCNACGMVGDRNPYICILCDFMVHINCLDLPRVININRHDHRISHTYHLDHGDWECGVCRKKIDWSFGAYSCKCCPNYAVHSKCATRRDVWDGEEREGKPEEEIEDPYQVISENEIIHFSHEHVLRSGGDNVADYEKMLCNACLLPITFDPFFKCVQCEFFLHKLCACLPRKKRNLLHNHKLTLVVDNDPRTMPFWCRYCLQFFDGFSYHCFVGDYCRFVSSPFDMRCASITEPFHHELHPHPLYRTSAEQKTCGACGKVSDYVLSCIVCEYALGMECATLPRKVKHRCDDHDLSLHHDAESSNGPLWCDICEEKTDPSIWYYGCDDCGITLHIKCVLGDMYYLNPGKIYWKGELVLNNGMFRHSCFVCGKRCLFPSFLKGTSESDSTVVYACSTECARTEEWQVKEPDDRERMHIDRQATRRRARRPAGIHMKRKYWCLLFLLGFIIICLFLYYVLRYIFGIFRGLFKILL